MTKYEEEVFTEEKIEVKEPSMYKVILHNDDYTPMDFVVLILMKFFNHIEEDAFRIMYLVHNTGIGICGEFTKEIAETKVSLVSSYAKEQQHPLKCTIEKK